MRRKSPSAGNGKDRKRPVNRKNTIKPHIATAGELKILIMNLLDEILKF